jgi:TetR/AcrR family transcriptional regulator, transcriptional repressor for nem operon
MKVKQPYNSEKTCDEILEAAFNEIYIHGFQAASLNKILKNINHTKGALYHHFPNKKRLGLCVVDQIIAPKMHSFFMAPLEETDDPIPVLCNIFLKKAETLSIEEIKYGCPLNNLTQEMSSIDADFNKSLKNISDRWVNTIVEALNRGKERGNVKNDVDSSGAALLIIATIEGAFGLGKTSDSSDFFIKCMLQLESYTKSLKV